VNGLPLPDKLEVATSRGNQCSETAPPRSKEQRALPASTIAAVISIQVASSLSLRWPVVIFLLDHFAYVECIMPRRPESKPLIRRISSACWAWVMARRGHAAERQAVITAASLRRRRARPCNLAKTSCRIRIAANATALV